MSALSPSPCGSAAAWLPRRPRAAAAAAAAAAAGGPVLLRDGVAVTPAPASAQELLTEQRAWSYTSARVLRGHAVVDWDLHTERLLRNMRLLSTHRPPAYAAFLAWLEQQQQGADDDGSAAGAALQRLLNPQVAAALQALDAAGGGPSEQAMLAVVLADAPELPGAGAAAPLLVLLWAKAVPPPSTAPGKVLVAGDPRPAAQAKHCEWVVARQPLEALRARAGVDEVVLSDARGALLEGLVSNFYVIADVAQLLELEQQLEQQLEPLPLEPQQQLEPQLRQPPAQAQPGAGGGASATDGLVLLTTGPAHDALPGVTQRRVLQACAAIGLRVVLQPARVQGSAAWREAFLTNAMKGIQPVTHVQLAPGTAWAAAVQDGAGPVTAMLQEALGGLQEARDMRAHLQQAQ